MRNIILLVISLFLLPIAVISFEPEETNFFTPPKEEIKNYILLNLNNQPVKMELESYIEGVVAAEMPASFNIEALKAQAVAARTYAYKKYIDKKVLQPTTSDQVYITKEDMKRKWNNEFDKYYAKIKQAVSETKDLIITYNNQPIKAYYFAISNGKTENSLTVFKENSPYLTPVNSEWETKYKDYLKYRKYSKSELLKKLHLSGNNITINKIDRSPSNYVNYIIINNKKFSGTEIRNLLGLRSNDFKFINKNDHYLIETKGFGHGVGMSQYGAAGMASQGYNYQEILKHYYQNTELRKINA